MHRVVVVRLGDGTTRTVEADQQVVDVLVYEYPAGQTARLLASVGVPKAAEILPFHFWQKIRVYEEPPWAVGPLRSIQSHLTDAVTPTPSGAAHHGALCRLSDGYFEWQCAHLHRTIREASECARDKWFAVEA